jgi:hypothetical protein
LSRRVVSDKAEQKGSETVVRGTKTLVWGTRSKQERVRIPSRRVVENLNSEHEMVRGTRSEQERVRIPSRRVMENLDSEQEKVRIQAKSEGVRDPSELAGQGSIRGTEGDTKSVTRNLKGVHSDILNVTKNLKGVRGDIRNVTKNRQGTEVVNQEVSQGAGVENVPTGRQDRQNAPEQNAQNSKFTSQGTEQKSS